MKRNGIYDNWKYRKNFEKYGLRRISESVQSNLAEDLAREKNRDSIIHNFDKNSLQQGKNWFDEGLSLEDAPENLKKNASFVAGYKKAQRVQYINEQVYNAGVDYYNRGIPFDEIPKIYINNEFFIAGYNSIREKTLSKL